MKSWRIPVTVTLIGDVELEAPSFDDAKTYAMDWAATEWGDLDLLETEIQHGVTEKECRVEKAS
jgi:hypothetical protein